MGQAIFIAHGKNKKPLEQLKRILEQFKIPYRVAIDEPNLGRPIGSKVREIMKSCNCAILIFTADEEFKDRDGKTIWRPSENVVYELGATGYLYDNRIVIMKETPWISRQISGTLATYHLRGIRLRLRRSISSRS